MEFNAQLIFDILLAVAGAAIGLFISMLRDEMKELKSVNNETANRVQRIAEEIPKVYVRKDEMRADMEKLQRQLESIESDIKKLLQRTAN